MPARPGRSAPSRHFSPPSSRRAAMMAPVSSFVAIFGVRVAHALPRRKLEIAFGVFLLLVSIRFIASLI